MYERCTQFREVNVRVIATDPWSPIWRKFASIPPRASFAVWYTRTDRFLTVGKASVVEVSFFGGSNYRLCHSWHISWVAKLQRIIIYSQHLTEHIITQTGRWGGDLLEKSWINDRSQRNKRWIRPMSHGFSPYMYVVDHYPSFPLHTSVHLFTELLLRTIPLCTAFSWSRLHRKSYQYDQAIQQACHWEVAPDVVERSSSRQSGFLCQVCGGPRSSFLKVVPNGKGRPANIVTEDTSWTRRPIRLLLYLTSCIRSLLSPDPFPKNLQQLVAVDRFSDIIIHPISKIRLHISL